MIESWERERVRRAQAALDMRRATAWREAREFAAELAAAGATTAVVFGSLVQDDRFTSRSDVDMLVFGVTPQAYWTAYGRAIRAEVPVDSVYAPTCRPEVRASACRTGVVLHGRP